MKTGIWRRCTAFLMILILVTYGFMQTIDASASGTDQPMEEGTFQESIGETVFSEMLSWADYCRYVGVSMEAYLDDPQEYGTDQIPPELLDSFREYYESRQYSDQAQTSLEDLNDIYGQITRAAGEDITDDGILVEETTEDMAAEDAISADSVANETAEVAADNEAVPDETAENAAREDGTGKDAVTDEAAKDIASDDMTGNDAVAGEAAEDIAAEDMTGNDAVTDEVAEDIASEDSADSDVAVNETVEDAVAGAPKRAPRAAAARSTAKLDESNYNLKYLIQSGYQMVCFGDAVIDQHTMGGVLIKGNLTETSSSKGKGIADSPNVTAPSYVAGYVTPCPIGGFNARKSQTSVQPLYVGSSNNVSDDGKTLNGANPSNEGYNHFGVVEINDNYVDWTKMKSAMDSVSRSLANSSTRTETQFNTDTKTVNAGDSVTFSGIGSKMIKVNITNSNVKYTVITISDSGTVYVPQVIKYNEGDINNGEAYTDMPVIFNFPNASKVIVDKNLSPSIGHIIAPDADVYIQDCNYNGIVICNKIEDLGEGHIKPWHGDLPKPGNHDVYIYKVDQYIQGVSGARLAVYDSAGNSVAEFTSTGEKQKLSLSAGTYTLRELEAPDGYTIAADIHFTVADNGIVTSGDAFMVCDNNTVKMKDEKKPCESYVIVRKVDPQGNLVKGAVLEIKNSCGEALHTFKTDGNSIYRAKLDPGDYVLSETEVPEGYQQAEDISFHIDCNGKVTIGCEEVQDVTLVMVDKRLPGTELKAQKTLKNGTLEGGDFRFTLTAVSGKGKVKRSYTTWWGQTYEWWETVDLTVPMPQGSDGKTYTVTNGQDGSISFGNIAFTETGEFTYNITEESGSYKDTSENILYDTRTYRAVVSVTETNGAFNSSVKYTDNNGNVISESAGNATHDGVPLFENTRVLPKLILKKVNAVDGDMTSELYSQIRFALYKGTKNKENMISGNAENGYWKLNDDGTLSFEEIQAGTTYIISEIKAPENYMKLTDDIIITVSETGEITLTGDVKIYAKLFGKGDEGCPDNIELNKDDKVLMVRNYPYIDMPEAGRNSRWLCFLLGPVISMLGVCLYFKGNTFGRKEEPEGGGYLL